MSFLYKAFLKSGPDYVSDQELKNLKLYKYGAKDVSPISIYIMQPYWSWCVNFFPLWMAPNLITLIGFGFIAANVLLMTYYSPNLEGPSERWVYFCYAIGMFLYQTFDNVDGKQARRTGSSSPLGELFDHGCDALNCSLGGLLQASALGLGQTWYSVLLPFLAMLPFYFSTWEEFHTGVLYLGYMNGPTEGLLMSAGFMALSGIVGPQTWQMNAVKMIGPWSQAFIPIDWRLIDVLALMLALLVCLTQVPPCILTVYQTCQKKNTSFVEALLQLTPFIVYGSAGYFWLAAKDSVMLHQHLPLFIFMAGVIFGRLATNVTLAHVTKSQPSNFPIVLVPLVFGAVWANFNGHFGIPIMVPQTELFYLYLCTAFQVLLYLHWSFKVIDRFCGFLKIKCLSIPLVSKAR